MSEKESPISKGPLRALRAWKYSKAGLIAAWQHEEAFRQEVLLVLVLSPLALYLGSSASEKVLLLASLFLILIIEVFNSALETAVDRFGSEHHVLSGRAKDLASAAVFLALLNAVCIWLIILLL